MCCLREDDFSHQIDPSLARALKLIKAPGLVLRKLGHHIADQSFFGNRTEAFKSFA